MAPKPVIFSDDEDESPVVRETPTSAKGSEASSGNGMESVAVKHKSGEEESKNRSGRKAKRSAEDDDDDDEEGEGDNLSNGDDDEDDDEDNEEELKKLNKDFIADEDDEEDDDQEEDEDRKKRKKHKSKKHKKRRKEDRESDFSEVEQDDIDLINETRKPRRFVRRGQNGEEDASNQGSQDIFFDDENTGEALAAEDSDEGSEMGGFIVDDNVEDPDDEVAQIDRRRRRKEAKAKSSQFGKTVGYSGEVLQTYQELFDYTRDYGRFFDMLDGEGYEQEVAAPEEHSYSDEDGDRVPVQSQPSHKSRRELKLTQRFDPSDVRENLLTEEDQLIRVMDIPERFQLRGGFTKAIAEGELDRESIWIYGQLKAAKMDSKNSDDMNSFSVWKNTDPQDILDVISSIVGFLKTDLLDIPTIYHHRRDYFENILTLRDLWRIYDFDLGFNNIETRRLSAVERWGQVQKLNKDALDDEFITSLFDRIDSLETLSEVSQYIKLRYPKEIQTIEDQNRKTFKKAQRTTKYDIAIKCNIDQLAKKFGLDAREYSAACMSGVDMPIVNSNISPEEEAADFVKGPYKTIDDALTAARLVLATEIASVPPFRRWVRRIHEQDAVLTVNPTKKGLEIIKPSHIYYSFLFLSDKPLHEFHDEQFLQILDAERQGLVTVTIHIEEIKKFLKDCESRAINRETTPNGIKWDDQRKLVIEQALTTIIFPAVVNFCKEKISIVIRDNLAYYCQMALESKINIAPYKEPKVAAVTDGWGVQEEQPDDDEDARDPKVLVITWGDGLPGDITYATFIKEDGNIEQSLPLAQLRQGPEQAADNIEALVQAIADHEPDVIAISGFRPNTCTLLHKFVTTIVTDAVSYSKISKAVPIFYVEDDAAKIYMRSPLANKEFPAEMYHPLVRYSVSIGRRVQDPLAELSRYANADDNEAVKLYLTPTQQFLSNKELNNAITKAFVNVVNQTCVDINKVVQFPHLSGVVRFISGLGPRKAQSLINRVAKMGELSSRNNLVLEKIFGANIFMNASSFIRIVLYGASKNYDEIWDVLDNTRIHPEDYQLARQMAADALDLDDAAVEDEENPSQHVAELMESKDVDKLHQLALDEFAAELKRQSNKLKKYTLNEILKELINPCKDHRLQFQGATEDAVFQMVTGETDYTLRPGINVQGIIGRVMDQFVRVILKNGLQGSLDARNLPGGDTSGFKERQPVGCRVVSVDKVRLSVGLNLQSENPDSDRLSTRVDQYFSREREDEEITGTRNKINRKSKERQIRRIEHPYFQSVNYKGAQQLLEKRAPGAMIIRPSTKGNNYFTITLKIDEGLYVHVNVEEKDKESEFTLGRSFIVDNHTYTELDEIIGRYVEPLFKKIYSIINNSKFKRLNLAQMKRYLTEQTNSSNTLSYGYIHAENTPGRFLAVVKKPGRDIGVDPISVTNKGIVFHKKLYDNIDAVGHFIKDRFRN